MYLEHKRNISIIGYTMISTQSDRGIYTVKYFLMVISKSFLLALFSVDYMWEFDMNKVSMTPAVDMCIHAWIPKWLSRTNENIRCLWNLSCVIYFKRAFFQRYLSRKWWPMNQRSQSQSNFRGSVVNELGVVFLVFIGDQNSILSTKELM